ncbi:MAG: response regulator, partial [Blautia sp.]
MSNSNILVVEDDFAIRSLITTALETENYKYHVAKNGNQAIMEAATQAPELILLDLGLPDIDGVDVIRKIRTWSTVPITVISARSEDKDKIDALDAGADDYITKPFSTAELLARIRGNYRRIQYIQNNQQGGDPVFHNGSLTIDYQMQTVYVKEEEIHVTP